MAIDTNEPKSNNGAESAERKQAVFDRVSVQVPMRNGTVMDALGYRLKSGVFALGSDTYPGTDIQPGERIIQYVRNSEAIFRIEPDGHIGKLDLAALRDGRVETSDVGYVADIEVEIGKPLAGAVGLNSMRDTIDNHLTNMWENVQLTKGPITEVLIRTSREIPSGVALPMTDTAIRIGIPKQFVGK